MENKIILIYNNKQSILNQIPIDLLNHIIIIFDLKIECNKFFYYFNLYLNNKFLNENHVLTNKNELNEAINEIKNNKIDIKIFVLEIKNLELNNKIEDLNKKILKNIELNNKIEELNKKIIIFNNEINNLRNDIQKLINKNNPIQYNYKIHFDENKIVKVKKNNLILNKSIKYLFKIFNLGKEWPKNTFLRCIPDNNEIFFLPTKEYILGEEEDIINQNYYYGFEVIILFKNINHIENKEYVLNCELLHDKEGKIGEENGSLRIKIEDD